MAQLAIIMFIFVEYSPEDGRKPVETCRRFTTCLFIVVSNKSTAVGIYIYIFIYLLSYKCFIDLHISQTTSREHVVCIEF